MLIASPSIFSSQTYVTVSSGNPRATRAPQASSSSRVIALSRLIIGTAWVTGANKRARLAADVGGERVVELDVGMGGGEGAQLADEGVEVAVGDLRVVELVVATVVVANELGDGNEASFWLLRSPGRIACLGHLTAHGY